MEQTIERSEAHREWVRSYKFNNEQQRCRVYGCSSMREGLSRYCSTHANRASDKGSAIIKPCDQLLALNSLSKQLAQRIKDRDLPDPENSLLAGARRVIPGGTAYVYANRYIETGMKVAEKARIIIATSAYKHSPERVLAYATLWSIAQELDRDTHGNLSDLKAYIRTLLGNDIATLADISKRWSESRKVFRRDSYYDYGKAPVQRVVSEDRVQVHKKQAVRGATKRKAGQLLLDTIARQLGPTRQWMNDPWAASYTAHIAERLATAGDRLYSTERG